MRPDTRRRLAEHFAEPNRRLYELLGRDLGEGSTILIDRKHELAGLDGESLVEIQVIEGEAKGERLFLSRNRVILN